MLIYPALLTLVVGFTLWAPDLYHRKGAPALWLAVGGASLLATLTLSLLEAAAPDSPGHPSFNSLFFWPVLFATTTGFALLALLVRWRFQPGRKTSWPDLVLGVVVWLVGVAVGGTVAAGVGLLLLSGMAP